MQELLSKKNLKIASVFGGACLATLGLLALFESNNDSTAKDQDSENEGGTGDISDEDIYDDETIIKVYKKWGKNLYPVYSIIQMKARELIREMDQRGPRPERWKEQLIMILTQNGRVSCEPDES